MNPRRPSTYASKPFLKNTFRRELTELKTRAVNLPAADHAALSALQQRIKDIQKLLRAPPRIGPPLPA